MHRIHLSLTAPIARYNANGDPVPRVAWLDVTLSGCETVVKRDGSCAANATAYSLDQIVNNGTSGPDTTNATSDATDGLSCSMKGGGAGSMFRPANVTGCARTASHPPVRVAMASLMMAFPSPTTTLVHVRSTCTTTLALRQIRPWN
jgi:hypothetical protein